MLLSIKEMEVHPLPFAQTFAPGAIDFSGSSVEQSGELRTEGVARLVPYSGGDFRVKGRLQTRLWFDCDRCLSRAELPLDLAFDLFYKPAAEALKAEEDEVSVDEDEAEMGFYEMPGLELEDILREQVLFALPMQRVCRPDCRGICPVCGGNRNENPCQCESRPVSQNFDALKSLHIETK